MARLAARGDERAAAGFGHRPRFDERKAEARLERRVVLRVRVRAIAEAHAGARDRADGGSSCSRIAGITPR